MGLRSFFKKLDKKILRPVYKGAGVGLLTGDPLTAISGLSDYYEGEKQKKMYNQMAQQEEAKRQEELSNYLARARGQQAQSGIAGSTLADIQLRKMTENIGPLTSQYRMMAESVPDSFSSSLGNALSNIWGLKEAGRYKGEYGERARKEYQDITGNVSRNLGNLGRGLRRLF